LILYAIIVNYHPGVRSPETSPEKKLIDEDKEKDPIIGVLTFNIQTILRMISEKPQVIASRARFVNCGL